jgi:O-methyltransferase
MTYTTVDLQRLKNLDALAHRIDALGVEGDVVECGTYNGGTGAILARVATRSPLGRHVYLLDSFEGLPPSSDLDGPEAGAYTGAFCGSVENVRAVLKAVGVAEDRVTVVKGWFADTVPSLEVEKIALLHIDADWYESVSLVLKHLYDKVERGGYVVLDDYGYWEGCRKAVHELLTEREETVSLTDVDGIGAFFQKQG